MASSEYSVPARYLSASSTARQGAQEEAGQLAAVAGVMTRGHQEGPGSRGPRRPLKAFLMTQREVHANPAPFMNTDESSRPLGARTRAEGDPGLEKPPSLESLVSWDKNILETTGQAPLSVVSRRTGAASDPGNSANRNNRETSVTISSSWSSRGPRPCRRRMCVAGKVSSAFCGLPQCTRPVVGSCSVTVGTPSCTTGRQRSAEDVAPDLLPGTDVTLAAVAMGAPVGARASAQTSAPISHSPTLPRSSLGHNVSVSWPRPKQLCPLAHCLPGAISVQGPADTVDPAVRCFPEADTWAPLSLGFRVQVASDASLCLLLDFGDGCGVQVRIREVSEGTAVTAFHQFGREGVYTLKAVIHSEFRGTEKELGPYYVDIGPATVSVSMNSSSIHKDGLLVLTDSHTDQKGTVVTHRFPTGPSWNVSFTSRTQVGGGKAWKPVTVRFQMQPVSVYTNGTVFATDTDITFLAVTKETVPLEFLWYFGEGPPVRTTSRSVRKRLRIPQWYSVTVQASSRLGRVASEPHRIRAQRRIVANRLASPSSALLNTSVTFECRLNFGSDVAFLWDFGDGAVGPGGSSASHSYSREGEFTVQVLAFNDVSTASLRKQLFVVREPCQPPPVKNMGPGKVQVWRSQPVNLGVTFESAILCDISQGLSYTWTFWNSEGARVPLPPAVSTHGQTLTVPGYFLQPGNYTALAKVQVEGSVVHSSYRVGVEVRARAPVSVISEGTHLFISRAPSFIIVLRGSQSYDPDSPGAVLRYHWKCTAASAPGHPCFSASSPHSLDAGAPTLSFPADSLSDTYDQFLVTLMVSSGGRNSSEAQVFLSPRPNSALRFVHISWVNFRDVFVNWNEELCLQAECEVCGQVSGLSYSWDLFLVNATEGTSVEVPFCRTVGLLGSAGLGAVSRPPESSPPSTEPSWPECHTTGAPFSQEPPQTRGQPGLSAVGKPSSGPTVNRHWVPTTGDAAAPGVTPQDQGSPGPSSPGGSSPSQGLSPSPSDFEAYYGNIQEAELSRGRQPADWPNPSLPGSDPSSSVDRGRGDGDNLLGPLPPTAAAGPPLMVDWPKSPVGRTLFHGYTASGITGQTVTIKPFTLSPGKTYVLQASVASKHGFLGRAQLYVTLRPAPWAVTCQVQPHRGLEAHTVFSIFCMSGRPDFHYKFSYWIGNGSRHTLYRGTDTQYYFALPAGEPLDDYKVMLSTEITDGSGSRVQPCAVAVTVLPRLHGGLCLDEDIYNSSLKHLSTLQLMGSYAEIRNYITMIARILSRWAAEDRSPPCGQWSRIQDALISSACRLPSADQEEMLDSVLLFRDLLRFPHKVSFTSAALVLKSTQTLLAQSLLSGRPAVAEGTMLELILLVSAIWEVSDQETPRSVGFLQEEGIKVISALLLDGLSAAKEHQLCVSTGQMEFCTLLHHDRQGAVQSLGPVRVHLPGGLAGQRPAAAGMQSPCYISQLMLFKKNPYPERRAPGQIGPLVTLSLFTCSGRRPISRQRLREPVVVEFGEEDGLGERRNRTTFALLQETVNFHRFTGRSESPQESLQIRIEFSRPVSRAFPVMVLVRFSEKPTPSDFLVKKVYIWDEPMVHVYVPAASLRDTSLGYLSLLDADYDRSPRNKYFAKAVNYTVRFQWLRCVFWETREWRSANSSPQPGASPGKVSCSYDRLAPVSVARRNLSAGFSVEGVSKLQRHPGNLLPSILIAVSVVLYALLVTKTRRVDRHEREKAGYIFLQENTPADHQLYAVVVDTGFRAPAHCSAKVYIVLCGENGVSEPRELYCPEKPLFERNSRHTFVLSTPALLGPLRRIRLWHDSRGPCPAWYVSHLMVQELGTGPARHWLFPAECWLAAGRGDGHVQWELGCLRRRPGFWKLLYSKFTEYLEDFHVWTSVYSRPSPSGFLRTPRLTVAFTLLCAYACLAALVTASRQERLLWALGAPDTAAGSFQTGLLCTLLASPAAQLLSLLLRVSQEPSGPRRVKPHLPPRRAPMGAAQDPNSHGRTPEARKIHKRNTLPGRAGARRRAAGGDDAGGPTPELEACGADPRQRAEGEEGAQVPTSGSGRLAVLQWPRAPPPWSGFAAWATCWMVSVACGLGTAFLGYRFNPTQCAQWLHLLTLSVLCCVFVTQPLLVGLVALGFAWRKRDDPHFFTESLREATKDLGSELEGRVRSPMAHHASQMEEMVAARQRARRLRWACPPSAAQLSVTRERMRRETRTRVALRDVCMHTLMLLLHWFVLCGKVSQDEYSLNQAIRNEFTRNARSSSCGLTSVGAWWDWSLTTLLDGLHGQGAHTAGVPRAQPRALGGKCYLMGALVIKQLRASSDSECELPSPPSVLTKDSPPTRSPQVGATDTSSVTDPAIQGVAASGPGDYGAREHWVLSLGSTRAAAHAALSGLRASRWIDRSTRAVSVHFTLYNPPTRLLSSVSLRTELLPAGGLALSPLVESVAIFHSDSSRWYRLTLPELVFLVLNLIGLCLHLSGMAETGVCSYWHSPGRWLELTVVGAGLAYHAASSHLVTLTGEVADHFQKGLFHEFLDLSLVTSWNQRVSWLQGTLSFVLTLKCICLVGVQTPVASCSFLTRRSLTGVFAAGLAGVLMLAAHSHLHAAPPGTFTDVSRGLPFRFPGRHQRDTFPGLSKSDPWAPAWCCGAFFIVTSTVWLGMLRGSLMTLVRKRKSFQSKSLVSLEDMTACMWGQCLALLGLERPQQEEAETVESQHYYLDEVSDLLEELLLKINGLSDSLRLPLPEQQSCDETEARAEGGPLGSISA
ncbi:polycystic kidney disease protein 1-like 1 [Prionailurus viverrinus]|uniref:polycystic kidney disease protein 1-like 1 n=1 Tax=Prionailurus viverrinus TaxID=61388 RepID=UPI001FF57AEC|nr:polycystic kidney disease protein 1-like 1 [Prionailurus viverrinus]